MSIFFQNNGRYITVMGQTYPHKDIIKSLGGTFVAAKKIWKIPLNSNSISAIKDLCIKNGGGDMHAQIPIAYKQPINFIKPNKSQSTKELTPKIKEKHKYSIKEIITHLGIHIKTLYPTPIWVIGEIEQVSIKQNAYFFSLTEKKHKQDSLAIAAVLWKNTLVSSKFSNGSSPVDLIKDGMSVCCLCQINFYENRSQVSLTIIDIDPQYTEGLFALEHKKIIAKLREQKLINRNKRHTLEGFSLNIGLISAENSRAYSDFCHQLSSRSFPGKIKFISAQMQGSQVSKQIIHALTKLSQLGCQAVVITRGGGSRADLRYFDDYDLAKFVANYNLPVISAIGHHDDNSILEEVSYYTCKTPTDAADFFIEQIINLNEHIKNLQHKITSITQKKIEFKKEQLQNKKNLLLFLTTKHIQTTQNKQITCKHLFKTKYQNFILNINSHRKTILQQIIYLAKQSRQQKQHQINLYKKTLKEHIKTAVNTTTNYLEKYKNLLLAADPKPWFNKGWTQLSINNTKILSIKQIKTNDNIQARLKDGHLKLKINDIIKNKDM